MNPLTVGAAERSVLVVDDDTELCQLLSEYLSMEGYVVEAVHTGRQGVDRALSDEHAIVVLDVMLPDLKGFEVLRRVRAQSRMPILMLTARGDEQDRILGLEMGADDYLAKPFNPRELSARIEAVLRRSRPDPAAMAPLSGDQIVVGDVSVDKGARMARRGGDPIELTTVEFDILEHLMRSAGRVLSRDALMEALYNRKATAFDRSMDMHISHIRRKLEGERTLIKTVRGIGYQFCRSSEEAAE